MSITAYAERIVTHYERGERWSCVMVGENLRVLLFGASDLELKTFGTGKTLGWWSAAPDRERPRDGG